MDVNLCFLVNGRLLENGKEFQRFANIEKGEVLQIISDSIPKSIKKQHGVFLFLTVSFLQGQHFIFYVFLQFAV